MAKDIRSLRRFASFQNALKLYEEAARQIVDLLRTQSKVKGAVLFGSRAKATHREGSDIDIALIGSSLTEEDRRKLSIDYDELFLPWKLDLVLYDKIESPELKEHIDRVGKTLF